MIDLESGVDIESIPWVEAEYSPDVVWWTGTAHAWGDGDWSPYSYEQSNFPGRINYCHTTKEAAEKVNRLWKFPTGTEYPTTLDVAKAHATITIGADWLLVMDIDMDVYEAYKL